VWLGRVPGSLAIFACGPLQLLNHLPGSRARDLGCRSARLRLVFWAPPRRRPPPTHRSLPFSRSSSPSGLSEPLRRSEATSVFEMRYRCLRGTRRVAPENPRERAECIGQATRRLRPPGNAKDRQEAVVGIGDRRGHRGGLPRRVRRRSRAGRQAASGERLEHSRQGKGQSPGRSFLSIHRTSKPLLRLCSVSRYSTTLTALPIAKRYGNRYEVEWVKRASDNVRCMEFREQGTSAYRLDQHHLHVGSVLGQQGAVAQLR
jgi:hypothetical protein